jgi:dTDP-4-amino-4,6-dideoxygalactose transaminase
MSWRTKMSKETLAINGGPKVRTEPWPARQHFGMEEKAAAMELFDQAIESGSPFGYNGPQEEAYCKEFAEFMGGGFSDAVNSGTNSVYVALKALELKPFTEVIVGAVTDPGGIMPIALLNCIPVVADTAPDSYNSGPEQIEERITDLTSAIVIPHIGGEPADMEGIMKVAQEYGLPVVEDCSQSHAASIKGKLAGTFGDVAAFSVMFGKHCCAGGQGGMVFTKSEDMYWKVRRHADRGKPFGLEGANGNVVPAINCNMDELHAVIGRVQLKKLPGIVERRRAFAAMLGKELETLDSVIVPQMKEGVKHSYWWWRLGIDEAKITCTKDEFCAALQAEGIALNPRYNLALPHTFEWFRKRAEQHPWNNPLCQGKPAREFPTPNAFAAMDKFFNLVIFESWGTKEIEDIVAAFKKVEKAYI